MSRRRRRHRQKKEKCASILGAQLLLARTTHTHLSFLSCVFVGNTINYLGVFVVSVFYGMLLYNNVVVPSLFFGRKKWSSTTFPYNFDIITFKRKQNKQLFVLYAFLSFLKTCFHSSFLLFVIGKK